VHRSKSGDLAKLHGELLRSRLAVAIARQTLIEALGDWMCGGDAPPPSPADIDALMRLCDARAEAEARYARCLATHPGARAWGSQRRWAN